MKLILTPRLGHWRRALFFKFDDLCRNAGIGRRIPGVEIDRRARRLLGDRLLLVRKPDPGQRDVEQDILFLRLA